MAKKLLEDFVKANNMLEQEAMNIIKRADSFMNPVYQYLAVLKDISEALDYGDSLINKTKCLMDQKLNYRDRNVATIPIWLTMAEIFKANALPIGIDVSAFNNFNSQIREMISQTNELNNLYYTIRQKKSDIANLQIEDERLQKELLAFSQKDPTAKEAESKMPPKVNTGTSSTPLKRPDFSGANPFANAGSGLKKKAKYAGDKQDYANNKSDSLSVLGNKQKAREKIEGINEFYAANDEFRKEINKVFLQVDVDSSDEIELKEALSYDKTLNKIDEVREDYQKKIRAAERTENAAADDKRNLKETVDEAITILTDQKAKDPSAGVYVYNGAPTPDQIKQAFQIFLQGLQPAIESCKSSGDVPKQLQDAVDTLTREFDQIDEVVKNRKNHLENMKRSTPHSGSASTPKDESKEKSAMQTECDEIVNLIEELLDDEFEYECVTSGFKSAQEAQTAIDKHAAAQKVIISKYDKVHKCIAALEECLNSGRKYLDEGAIKNITKVITKAQKTAGKLERKFMEIADGVNKISKFTAKHGVGVKDGEAKQFNEPDYFVKHQKDLEVEEAALAEQAEQRRGFKHL